MTDTEATQSASTPQVPDRSHQADPANRARLRWRARRGMLENDLVLTRYLDAHELEMTDTEVDAFSQLMNLTDTDLMDLLLAKKQLDGELDVPHIRALVKTLQSV